MGRSRSEHAVEFGRPGPTTSTRHWILRLMVATAAAVVASLHMVAYSPRAYAEPCPDVQVVFARGTFEPVGVGATGQAFVDALRAQMPGKSIDVYPVNYPASLDFARAADGVADASTEVQSVATACPKTKMVLGGYSQGAAVIAYITTDTIPPDFTLPAGITGPMPATVAPHVAAVTLFGKPSSGFLNMVDANAPPINIGHAYTAKALDLCVADDPVCSGQGGDPGAHGQYAVNGMADQAATFATDHVSLKT
jgi:cutinase